MTLTRWGKTGLMVGVLLLAGGVAAGLWLQQPKFGALPDETQRAGFLASPNYDGEIFKNQIETPMFADERSFLSVLLDSLSSESEGLMPDAPLPVATTNLASLNRDEDLVVWLGHSSFFVQLGGQRLLIDPVFSDNAAPVFFANPAFAGTSVFRAEQMPPVDYLLISHDHWDHLDYPTALQLRDKVGKVIVPLGVGAYFEDWGYDSDRIEEGDWYSRFALSDAVTLHLVPARHYSGRLLVRNRTLWTGFVLETADRKLLFSGDSGYGPHFEDIRARFGDFDLVALDQGQYDPAWPYIHMTPEEAAQAARDLRAGAFLPIHVGRFSIANHSWQDPFERASLASQQQNYQLLTPRIGDVLPLSDLTGLATYRWWE